MALAGLENRVLVFAVRRGRLEVLASTAGLDSRPKGLIAVECSLVPTGVAVGKKGVGISPRSRI